MYTNHHNKDSYIVLARKYRPRSFAEIKGQPVLVQTISNAIKLKRIPHAFLLTGIRGVGKTTAARIITKTLNCSNVVINNDKVLPCGECDNCLAFLNEKHPDVIEIDAASKTGVADIREVIDNCRYLPQMAKYKIYIIDEVHMLSINAFNALLKTLEEPPAHVIFIFATTEVRKVPITILSRCQRFDLRRLAHEEIITHLQYILSQENLTAESEALDIIARCCEGSVRDSLSLLDQMLMYSDNGKIIAKQVSLVLGIGDKSEVVDLFEFIVSGEVEKSLKLLTELYYKGIDPVVLMNELLEIINLVTKFKCIEDEYNSGSYLLAESEIKKLKILSAKLGMAYLTILWQMLLKAINEMSQAASVIGAAEMLIIRICYIADKPMPIDLLNKTDSEETNKKNQVTSMTNVEKSYKEEIKYDLHHEDEGTPKIKITAFRQLVELFYQNKEMILYHHLYEDIHLVKFEQRVLKFRQKSNVPHNFANQVSNYLKEWTGIRWVVTLSTEKGELTLKEVDDMKTLQEKNEIAEDRIVKEVMKQFEGSKITSITKKEAVEI